MRDREFPNDTETKSRSHLEPYFSIVEHWEGATGYVLPSNVNAYIYIYEIQPGRQVEPKWNFYGAMRWWH